MPEIQVTIDTDNLFDNCSFTQEQSVLKEIIKSADDNVLLDEIKDRGLFSAVLEDIPEEIIITELQSRGYTVTEE